MDRIFKHRFEAGKPWLRLNGATNTGLILQLQNIRLPVTRCRERVQPPETRLQNDWSLNISLKSVASSAMILEQLKALGNDTRMQMMEWLKDPLSNFPPQDHGDPAIGVCVTHLQHKAGLSPSTASAHLAILQRAGFVLTTRIGKWTYYRRNEQAIDDFAARLKIEL